MKGKGFAPAEEGGLEGMEALARRQARLDRLGRRGAVEARVERARRRSTRRSSARRWSRRSGATARVVGITAAMNSGTGLSILQEAEPDHYFDVGIAEQQAVLFAAGLALEGAKPVCAIYSTFLQRAYDQIVHDVCLQKLNVVFAMDRAGLVGDDGPTHHGAFDIAYLRCLPNMVLMAPRDEAMLARMLRTALTYDGGPVALRYPRGEGVGVPMPRAVAPIEIGRGEVLREGERVAIVGYGSGVQKALEAADLLAEGGLDVTVADARFAKPLDARAAELARGRARAAGHGRGGRPGRRLRIGRVGVPERRRPATSRASCASACPTATSRTASPRCCMPRSASRAGRSRSASRPPSRPARARSPARDRRPAPAGPRADREPCHRRGREPGPPDLEAERAAYLQTAIELGGAVEEVARVEDVVIPDAEGGSDTGAGLLAERARRFARRARVAARRRLVRRRHRVLRPRHAPARQCLGRGVPERRLPPGARAPLSRGGAGRAGGRRLGGGRGRARSWAPIPARVVVGGDSAGGNLAAVAARHERGAVRAQLLVYPALDATMDSDSYREFADGPMLRARDMEQCWRTYLGGADRDGSRRVAAGRRRPRRRRRRRTSPSPATTSCATTACATREALRAAGVDVTVERYEDMVAQLPALGRCRRACPRAHRGAGGVCALADRLSVRATAARPAGRQAARPAPALPLPAARTSPARSAAGRS